MQQNQMQYEKQNLRNQWWVKLAWQKMHQFVHALTRNKKMKKQKKIIKKQKKHIPNVRKIKTDTEPSQNCSCED